MPRSRRSNNNKHNDDISSDESDPNRSRHRSRSRSRRRSDPPPEELILVTDEPLRVATPNPSPTTSRGRRPNQPSSSRGGNNQRTASVTSSTTTTGRGGSTQSEVASTSGDTTTRWIQVPTRFPEWKSSRRESSSNTTPRSSVVSKNHHHSEDDDERAQDNSSPLFHASFNQRRPSEEFSMGDNTRGADSGVMTVEMQELNLPESERSGVDDYIGDIDIIEDINSIMDNSHGRNRSMETVNIENVDDLEQQAGYGRRSNRGEDDDEEVRSQQIQRGLKKQRSRRKARDRDDFRTSFANPQTNLMLANDDDPNFWGVSNRWFSDAGEFVGELPGMATRRASVDTDKGSSYSDYNLPKVEGHHEIVHAIDDMEDDNRGVVFGGDGGFDFSDRDDTPLFDELSSLGDTPTGIFTDMTRRQVIRGAWAISISFMIAWIAVQVALQHSSTFQEWSSGMHKTQSVFTPRRSKRYGQIKAQLVEISGEDVFMNEQSPQHRALMYLADGDSLALDPHDPAVSHQLKQRYALAVIYFATGGSDWKTRTYWLTGRHECGWMFVICSGVDEHGNITDSNDSMVQDDDYSNRLDSDLVLEEGKTITGLSLYNQGLRGQLPNEILMLQSLHVLDLGNNFLTGIILPELGRLQHLHKLYLENNRFHGGIEAMQWLTSLKRVNLENNLLTGTLPFDFGKLKMLEEVRVGQNKLHGHVPSSLLRSETLIKLDLHGNEFTGDLDIHEMSILKDLYLYNNKMTGQIGTLCYVKDTLVDLRLNNNSFSGKLPPLECTMEKLELLSLAENDLTGAIPDMLGDNLPSLRELHLYENQLLSTIPSSIFKPENLTAVLLGNNQLTGSLTADMVNDARNLAHLYVNSNRMSGNLDDFAQARNLDSLKKLRLEYNSFSGTIPQLNMIDTLELLYLYNNSFVGTLDNLGSGVNLRKLKVSNNTFEGKITSKLGDLKNLQVLSLNGNNFVGTLPTQLEGLTSLQELRVEHNDIAGEMPLGICDLRKSSLGTLVSDCGGKLPEFFCSCCTECI